MIFVIILIFVAGYACIALEAFTKVNKAAVALLMCVLCWTAYCLIPGHDLTSLPESLGETAETLFFLMGAMTIVEIVDANGGFNFVRDTMKTRSKRKLLWRVALMTFFLSAILDNLTTSIVMVMVLRKLIQDPKERLVFASMVIVAANSGGAFSPIGDVTTIMLWIKGMVSTGGVLTELFIPSMVSMVVPAALLSLSLKGKFDKAQNLQVGEVSVFTKHQRQAVFCLGVGGLVFVPIFKTLTHLPPYMGILLVLGLLWTVTEIFNRHLDESDPMAKRVTHLLTRIDMGTILFFLGILMAVLCLKQVGVLNAMGDGLNEAFSGNPYLITSIIGVLSSIVDNVPLVAACMNMYDVVPDTIYAVDGSFWQLLAYCAGVGGSMLIIGSAAGVVVMGLEKITFGWYMKHISWLVFVGYVAGILVYALEKTIF